MGQDEPKMIYFDGKMSSNDTKIMCLDEEKRETSNCCKDSEQFLEQSFEIDSAEKPLKSIRIESRISLFIDLDGILPKMICNVFNK